MRQKVQASDNAGEITAVKATRRFLTMLFVIASPIILMLVFALVINTVNAVRTYRDTGVMPGSIVKDLEIRGDIPSWFTDEDMRSAADVLAEYINGCKFTVLDAEYDNRFQDYLETEYPDYPDNCRMVVGFTEYNYGNDAANIAIHGREHIWAFMVRDDVNSPWQVIEHGYI